MIINQFATTTTCTFIIVRLHTCNNMTHFVYNFYVGLQMGTGIMKIVKYMKRVYFKCKTMYYTFVSMHILIIV